MARIARKQVESKADTLNTLLGLPVATYAKNDQGGYDAQIGNIHVQGINGGHNIYQMFNAAGGCTQLAVGLTLREAYEWLNAACIGAQLAQKHAKN